MSHALVVSASFEKSVVLNMSKHHLRCLLPWLCQDRLRCIRYSLPLVSTSEHFAASEHYTLHNNNYS
uniref:Uncharacterized protein n=1 Tax=Cannabis sativa TaxID=3483 RepID=A0A803QYL5_CANSA